MFSIIASDPIHFHQFQEELLSKHRGVIHEMEVYPIISAAFFSRKYLQPKDIQIKSWDIGGDIGQYNPDDIDQKIIVAMNENNRVKTTVLADKLNSTSDIINYRIKKLEAKKVIVGYRANLNLSTLGMALYKTQLTLGSSNPKHERAFFEYCLKSPNIIYLVQQIGRCQLEIEIEAKDTYSYFRIIDEIHRIFPALIKNTDTILIRSETLKWVKVP